MTDHTKGSGAAPWRRRYRPYIVAFVLAFVMTMFIAPEINEGDGMLPTLKDGQVIVLTKTSYAANRDKPPLGQVVVLEKTVYKDVSNDNIISRVVGLPGDRMQSKNGKLYRNGKLYKIRTDAEDVYSEFDVTLEDNQVFILGDNRKKAKDSSNKKIGAIDMRDIKGNAKIVIWPLSEIGGIK